MTENEKNLADRITCWLGGIMVCVALILLIAALVAFYNGAFLLGVSRCVGSFIACAIGLQWIKD